MELIIYFLLFIFMISFIIDYSLQLDYYDKYKGNRLINIKKVRWVFIKYSNEVLKGEKINLTELSFPYKRKQAKSVYHNQHIGKKSFVLQIINHTIFLIYWCLAITDVLIKPNYITHITMYNASFGVLYILFAIIFSLFVFPFTKFKRELNNIIKDR